MKKLLLSFLTGALVLGANAQELYLDYEGTAKVTLYSYTGLPATTVNPDQTGINASANVAYYTRSIAEEYDWLMYQATSGKIADVADYLTGTKKMSMMVYSEHPGTTIEITLVNSSRLAEAYPAGRHSTYRAVTSLTNTWELIEFDFIFRPDEFELNTNLDVVTISFEPGTFTGNSYYFDNLMGPEFAELVKSTFIYDNFESIRRVDYGAAGFTAGVANPSPNAVNGSSLVAQYVRSAADYEFIYYKPKGTFKDLEPYMTETVYIAMDVYSPAAGVPIELFIQDDDIVTADNYPAGRHSRFTAVTTTSNEWETLIFELDSRPDMTVAHEDADAFVLGISSGSAVPGTYYIDNIVGPEIRQYQTIDITDPGMKTEQDLPFDIEAMASSGMTLTYSLISGPATLNGNTVTLTGSGTVVVQISQAGDADYYPVDSLLEIEVSAVTGTINGKNSSVRLFPNPAYDRVTIDGVSDITSVTVRDVSGREVYSGREKDLDVSGLNPGLYLIEVEGVSVKFTGNFLKK